jgi:hypothetical protein
MLADQTKAVSSQFHSELKEVLSVFGDHGRCATE